MLSYGRAPSGVRPIHSSQNALVTCSGVGSASTGGGTSGVTVVALQGRTSVARGVAAVGCRVLRGVKVAEPRTPPRPCRLPERSSWTTVTRLLSDLVAIPSVNPMGRPLSGPGFLERGMTDYLEGFFRELGVALRAADGLARPRQRAGSLRAPRRAGRVLLFDAHQDTVPTDGMTIEPFEPRIEGGRLYGRGSATSRGHGGDAHGLRPAVPRAAARARRRWSWPARSTRSSPTPARRTWPAARTGPTWRSSPSRPGSTSCNCHKGAVRWKIRTQGSPATARRPHLGRQRHLPDGPASRRPGRARGRARRARRPTRSSARPASRSAGSRGGRASTSCPTGARSRSTAG